MLCLPPHTTHEAQPLDCGVFGPLKSHWSNVCHAYYQNNPGRIIIRFQFSGLFSQGGVAVSPANVSSGFSTCGIYPFNPSAISVPTNQVHDCDLPESEQSLTGSAFVADSWDSRTLPSTSSKIMPPWLVSAEQTEGEQSVDELTAEQE